MHKYFVSDDGKQIGVDVLKVDIAWAKVHYRISESLSQFLDQFRVKLAKNSLMPVKEVQKFLEQLIKHMMEMDEGSQTVLPFLLLDELVRRGSSKPDARKAVLEITLFDSQNNPTDYIPIIG
jgi:hypothetical protein